MGLKTDVRNPVPFQTASTSVLDRFWLPKWIPNRGPEGVRTCSLKCSSLTSEKKNLRQVALHMCISSKHTHMYTHATTRKLQCHQTYGTRCTHYCTKPNLTHICTHTLYKLHTGRSPQCCRTQFSNLCNTKSKEVCDIPSTHLTQYVVCVC